MAASEIIGMIKYAYEHPEKAVIRIREIVSHGQPVRGEEVAMRDGRTCLRDFIPIDVDGMSFGRLWHHIDISERKWAEDALKFLVQCGTAPGEDFFQSLARYPRPEPGHGPRLHRQAAGRVAGGPDGGGVPRRQVRAERVLCLEGYAVRRRRE